MAEKPSVMIIDDDPLHLQIYRLILENAGLSAVTMLVKWSGVDLPDTGTLDAVLLDYSLAGDIKARDVAQQVKNRYPTVPILLLSDLPDAPVDIVPFVVDFVRKGNPAALVARLCKLLDLPQATPPPAPAS